jgi:hypothetical protein
MLIDVVDGEPREKRRAGCKCRETHSRCFGDFRWGSLQYHVFCPIFPEKHVELLRPAFRRLFEIDSRFESVV